MEIIKAIDLVLQNVVVRWLLLIATIAAIATATWCKIQIGTVRLQRDAAQGREASCMAGLNMQNEAVKQAGKESEAQKQKIADARTKAEQAKKEADEWRKIAQKTPLTGTCEQMVDQVIKAVQ